MKKVFILSGAGLSAESGIKTFRDHDGLWENHNVMQVCSTQGWEADRDFVTQFYNKLRVGLADKHPHAAHYALSRLEKTFPKQICNLTQNVDDLLEKAGCTQVIHLHGTLVDLRCESCGHTWHIGYRLQGDDRCPKCESIQVRHNVVMFGESAPNYRYIYQAVEECELFVAIGTSGHVIDIVELAKQVPHSILINPKQEEYVTMFGSFEKSIDSFFSEFIQKGAVDAAEELENRISDFLGEV